MLISIAQAVALTLFGWPFGEVGGRLYLRWKRREKPLPAWQFTPLAISTTARMTDAVADEIMHWQRNASAYPVSRGMYATSIEHGLSVDSWSN